MDLVNANGGGTFLLVTYDTVLGEEVPNVVKCWRRGIDHRSMVQPTAGGPETDFPVASNTSLDGISEIVGPCLFLSISDTPVQIIDASLIQNFWIFDPTREDKSFWGHRQVKRLTHR